MWHCLSYSVASPTPLFTCTDFSMRICSSDASKSTYQSPIQNCTLKNRYGTLKIDMTVNAHEGEIPNTSHISQDKYNNQTLLTNTPQTCWWNPLLIIRTRNFWYGWGAKWESQGSLLIRPRTGLSGPYVIGQWYSVHSHRWHHRSE